MVGFEEAPIILTWGCTSSAGWCIQFKLDNMLSLEGVGKGSKVLVSGWSWSFMVLPGWGWPVAACGVLTIEEESWPFFCQGRQWPLVVYYTKSSAEKKRQECPTPSSPWITWNHWLVDRTGSSGGDAIFRSTRASTWRLWPPAALTESHSSLQFHWGVINRACRVSLGRSEKTVIFTAEFHRCFQI